MGLPYRDPPRDGRPRVGREWTVHRLSRTSTSNSRAQLRWRTGRAWNSRKSRRTSTRCNKSSPSLDKETPFSPQSRTPSSRRRTGKDVLFAGVGAKEDSRRNPPSLPPPAGGTVPGAPRLSGHLGPTSRSRYFTHIIVVDESVPQDPVGGICGATCVTEGLQTLGRGVPVLVHLLDGVVFVGQTGDRGSGPVWSGPSGRGTLVRLTVGTGTGPQGPE